SSFGKKRQTLAAVTLSLSLSLSLSRAISGEVNPFLPLTLVAVPLLLLLYLPSARSEPAKEHCVCMSLYPTVELLKGLRKKRATSKQLITTILFSFSTLFKRNHE
ncbi:hypothetical protein IGI04_032134, partial [Brassica rapa subsp. trilocularis]